MVTAIINGNVILPDGLCRGILVLEDGRIKGIQNNIPAGAEVIDAEGNYVSPGFISVRVFRNIQKGGTAEY